MINTKIDGAIIFLDLKENFMIDEVAFITVVKRTQDSNGIYVPVANTGYMWQDNLGNVYVGGGHFWAQPWPKNWTYWEGSQYFLEKKNIPDANIWKYDLNYDNWSEVLYTLAEGTPPLRRLASSGYISIPSINMSYAYGYV